MTNPSTTPLTPHKYPIWVLFFMACIVFCFIYSFRSTLVLSQAAWSLRQANIELDKRNNKKAEEYYQQVLNLVPTSSEARVRMAIMYFANGNSSDDNKAIVLLETQSEKISAAGKLTTLGNFQDAMSIYKGVLESDRKSQEAKIGLAEVYFSNADKSDDRFGLSLLDGLEIRKDDWDRLVKVMPQEYRSFFKEIKK